MLTGKLTAMGHRSGLEDQIALQLKAANLPYHYEEYTVPYVQPAQDRKYKPDFVLLHNGIVVETKGRFLTADRKKHLLIADQHPDLDLRFVFSNPNAKISKKSLTTYAKWCDKHQFQYAKKTIPVSWLEEPPLKARLTALKDILKSKGTS